MILVVGGIASGKRAYAHSLGYSDAEISNGLGGERPVLCDAQDLMRAQSADPVALAQRLAKEKQVVLYTEVGSGIVPLSREERDWRDRAGALSKELAARAEAVVRMACGIPQVLKGDLGKSDAVPESEGAKGDHPAASASFFSNRACKYFPCHEGVDEADFNCLFCYCPLYALGPDCGGNFVYSKNGRKNCKHCALPHLREDGAKLVSEHYEKLAELARR